MAFNEVDLHIHDHQLKHIWGKNSFSGNDEWVSTVLTLDRLPTGFHRDRLLPARYLKITSKKLFNIEVNAQRPECPPVLCLLDFAKALPKKLW
jgi:hypothetical protein